MSMIDVSDTERRIAERLDPERAGALEVSTAAGGLSFGRMEEVMNFAKIMALSRVAIPKHLRGDPGACMAVVMQAIEWRLSPYAVANKSYSVNDRLAYESQLIQAVILQRAPIKGRFNVEYSGSGDKRVCKVSARLRDGDQIVDYTSPEFGRITPKNSPLWKSDPDQQQFYYSGRALCRRHFPDVLLGVYAEDEIDRAPHHGPEHARDVTPPRSISDKLDRLAGKAAAPAEPAHDPETGEIAEQQESSSGAPAAPEASEAGAEQAPRESETASDAADHQRDEAPPPADDGFPGDEPTVLSEADKLLDLARSKATEGRRVFDAWWQKIRPEQRDMLAPHSAGLVKMAGSAHLAGQTGK